MNVTKQDLDAVSARLTVSVTEDDYKDKVTKELKKIGQTHTLPGFRKGHVPFGELNRRFGREVTSDVINREVYEAVANYLKDNNIAILGEPVPVEVVELDLKNKKDYDFQYDLALAPALDIKLDKDVKMDYTLIEVSDDMINEQVEALRKRFGAQVPGEEVEPDALVKGAIMELNADGTIKEGDDAIQVVAGIVAPMYFKSKEEADKFAGKKVGDKVVFNPWNTCNGDPAELSSMLQIDKDKAADVKADFELAISEIIVVRPAELNEEFYTNVFGPDKVKNEDEFRAEVKNMIAAQLLPNSESLFRYEAQKYLMDNYAKMELPVAVLKKWLVNRNEELNADNIDEEFAKMEKDLQWQLIKEEVARMGKVEIKQEDLNEYAKMIAARQFAQYGMTNMGDDIIEKYAKNLLDDKNYRQQIITEVGDHKLFDAIKGLVTINEKTVTLDEFKKIADAINGHADNAE